MMTAFLFKPEIVEFCLNLFNIFFRSISSSSLIIIIIPELDIKACNDLCLIFKKAEKEKGGGST